MPSFVGLKSVCNEFYEGILQKGIYSTVIK